MKPIRTEPCERTRPASCRGGRWLAIALLGAAFLFGGVACQTYPSAPRITTGKCSVCGGTGRYAGGSICPHCMGIGVVRVAYSYPVIDEDE